MMEIDRQAYQHSPPPTLHPLRRHQAQLPPPDTATKPGRCKRSCRNLSFDTGRLASSYLREGKEGGGKRPGIRKQVNRCCDGKRALPLALPTPRAPKARDPGDRQVHLREVDNCSSKTRCSSAALLANKFCI